MRDNISIIFAAIIGVFILIVLPLFSLMSRQDSIAYNKVLTLTTEFVDNARTKGYITEKDYTDYLTKLSLTGNTYKVEMEFHDKLLIEELNNEGVFKEDALIYYNKDIITELELNGDIVFEQDDEFYVKVYNTNITTASLLYNYFVRAKIPPKVINIGYGGRILNSTGESFEKTDFSSAYSSFIRFGEVKNGAGETNEICYDEGVGIYNMKYCIRYFEVEEDNNDKELYVAFSLNNFKFVGDENIIPENIEDIDEEAVRTEILENVKLTGQIKEYDKEILDLEIVNGKVTGTIKISNIKLNDGIVKTISKIKINEGLGYSSEGVVSSEASTDDLTFGKEVLEPAILSAYLEKTGEDDGDVYCDFTVMFNEVDYHFAYYTLPRKLKNEIFIIKDSETNEIISKIDDYEIIEGYGNIWYLNIDQDRENVWMIYFDKNVFASGPRNLIVEYSCTYEEDGEEPVSLSVTSSVATISKDTSVDISDITSVNCTANTSNTSVLGDGAVLNYTFTFEGIELTEDFVNAYIANYVQLVFNGSTGDGLNYNITNIATEGNELNFDIKLDLSGMSKGTEHNIRLQYGTGEATYEKDDTIYTIYTGDISLSDITKITVTPKTSNANILYNGDSIRYEITFDGITLNEDFVDTWMDTVGLRNGDNGKVISGLSWTKENREFNGNKLTFDIKLNLSGLSLGTQCKVALCYTNTSGTLVRNSRNYTVYKTPPVPSGFTALGYTDSDGDDYNYTGYFRIEDEDTGRQYVWIEYTGTGNLTGNSSIDISIKNNDGFYIATKRSSSRKTIENAISYCEELYEEHSEISSCLTYSGVYTYLKDEDIWDMMKEVLLDKWYNHKNDGYACYIDSDGAIEVRTHDYFTSATERFLEMLYFK